MLPLNVENVEYVFKNGVLLKGAFPGYRALLDIPDILLNDPRGAANWWVTQGRDRRWRVIIHFLDCVEETELADELIPFSEPPSGM